MKATKTLLVGATVEGLRAAPGLRMFADWTDRIAAGEVPPTPPRPQGIERNVVISLWDWADQFNTLGPRPRPLPAPAGSAGEVMRSADEDLLTATGAARIFPRQRQEPPHRAAAFATSVQRHHQRSKP